MARWGDEKTLKFILLYKNYECLWNVRSPLYKNKIVRENAYQSLLESFNDGDLDMKGMKIKIKNLRSIYHAVLKKVKVSKHSESEGSVYIPSLSWFEEMHGFLGDLAECRDIVSTQSETFGPALLPIYGLSIRYPSRTTGHSFYTKK